MANTFEDSLIQHMLKRSNNIGNMEHTFPKKSDLAPDTSVMDRSLVRQGSRSVRLHPTAIPKTVKK